MSTQVLGHSTAQLKLITSWTAVPNTCNLENRWHLVLHKVCERNPT